MSASGDTPSPLLAELDSAWESQRIGETPQFKAAREVQQQLVRAAFNRGYMANHSAAKASPCVAVTPQRYDVYAVNTHYEDEGPETEHAKSASGKWVKWEDVASLFERNGE